MQKNAGILKSGCLAAQRDCRKEEADRYIFRFLALGHPRRLLLRAVREEDEAEKKERKEGARKKTQKLTNKETNKQEPEEENKKNKKNLSFKNEMTPI